MSGHIFKSIVFVILALLGLYLTIFFLCPNSDKVSVNFEQTSTPSREFDKNNCCIIVKNYWEIDCSEVYRDSCFNNSVCFIIGGIKSCEQG